MLHKQCANAAGHSGGREGQTTTAKPNRTSLPFCHVRVSGIRSSPRCLSFSHLPASNFSAKGYTSLVQRLGYSCYCLLYDISDIYFLMPVPKSRVYQLAQDWKGFDAIKHLVVLYVLSLFLTATIANTTCSIQWRFVQFSWLRLEISSSISGQTARRYISRAL